MKLVLIPPGEFMMGSPATEANRDDDEQLHSVRITEPYFLGMFEVTQDQWKAVMGTEPWKGKQFVQEDSNCPASHMDWNETLEFCAQLNRSEPNWTYRLPTEAEWEFACRGGSQVAYSFGDSAADLLGYAWIDANSEKLQESFAHAVGRKRPNAFGLFDMYGNVCEWCADWYGPYVVTALVDPMGAGHGTSRIIRGGGFLTSAKLARSADRFSRKTSFRASDLGFRVARTVQTARDRLENESLASDRPKPISYTLKRADIPPDKLKAAGGGDPQNAPAELVAILGDHRLNHWGPVNEVAFSPDGAQLATGSDDGSVRLWSAKSGDEQHVLSEHDGAVRAIAYFPRNKSLLVSASSDKRLRLFSTATGRLEATFGEHGAPLTAVAVNKSGSQLACADEKGTLYLYDGKNRSLLHQASTGHGFVRALCFLDRGEAVATAGDDKSIRVWDAVPRLRERLALTGHAARVWSIAQSPKEMLLASVSDDRTLRVWDLKAGKQQNSVSLPNSEHPMLCVAFAPDGKSILTCGERQSCRLWPTDSLRDPRQFTWSLSRVAAIDVAADGNTLALASNCHCASLWDLRSEKRLLAPKGHSGDVSEVQFDARGELVVSANREFEVRLWDAQQATPHNRISEVTAPWRIEGLAFSPDGKSLATAQQSTSKCITLFSVETGKETLRLAGHWPWEMVWSPDGRTIATTNTRSRSGVPSPTLTLWDIEKKAATPLVKEGEDQGLLCLAYHPNGDMLATAGVGPDIKIWDLRRRSPSMTLRDKTDGIRALTFSNDGRFLGVAGQNDMAQIWSVAQWKVVATLSGHTNALSDIAIRPDGTTVATSSTDGSVGLWDTATGKLLKRIALAKPRGAVNCVELTPDGKYLLTGNANGTLYMLDPLVDRASDVSPAPAIAVAPLSAERASELQRSWAEHLGVQVEFANSIGMKLRLVPPGQFQMGASAGTSSSVDERPQHSVQITRACFVGAHEVTIQQWRTFLRATRYEMDSSKPGNMVYPLRYETKSNPKGLIATWENPGYPQEDNHPVVGVSWNDVCRFCEWLSDEEKRRYRLPTEAEWEYFTRAGTTTRFPSCDAPESLLRFANVSDAALKKAIPTWNEPYGLLTRNDRYPYTSPVGSFEPNQFGLFDVIGNVAEWCNDWHGPYQPGAAVDPQGPASGERRVLRGDGWNAFSSVSNRYLIAPSHAGMSAGFRVVCEAPPPNPAAKK